MIAELTPLPIVWLPASWYKIHHLPAETHHNLTSLRSDSTVSFVEPGPHGSRSGSSSGTTKYRRGPHGANKQFYTDDDMPASSSDEMFLL